ncbi:MAG: SelB C-terminal domain-containing protein [Dermatophilaceae bacterium]
MFVVATAGHVDHGKSTLVRALTGMEPDRWAEERRRGLTIDLGFVWTTLSGSGDVAFVDVPGHRRFIGNMLAGLGPVPVVLFVVAADSGWCEQSAEHLQAIDALGIQHGVLAVTRSDLADPAPVLADATSRIAKTSLGEVASVAVSGLTGDGLEDLRAALDAACSLVPEPDPSARLRLWIDRAFTIRGSGTVVTGTLGDGTLRVGDRVEVAEQAYVVRGLHTLGTAVEMVTGPARVAVNVRGLSPDEVVRGDALLTPGAWAQTSAIDVRVDRPATDLPTHLTLHVGSAAVPARVRSLDGAYARVSWEGTLPLERGDRAILRDPGDDGVLVGAEVLDSAPPSLRRRGAASARAAELAALEGNQLDPLAIEVARRGILGLRDAALLGFEAPTLADLLGHGRDGLEAAVGVATAPVVMAGDALAGMVRLGEYLVSIDHLRGWEKRLLEVASTRARTHLLDPALSLESARRAVGIPDLGMVKAVAGLAGLQVAGGRVRLPGARPALGQAQTALDEILDRLAESPCAAPEQPELDAAGLDSAHLAAAEADGQIVRLPGDIVLAPDGPARAMRVLAGLPQPFTTSQARAALGTTRRVVIPLLEHLDARGWTRRIDTTHREVVTPARST